MKRMKTFLIYALLIIGFWIFSNIMINVIINGTYKTKRCEVYISSPEVIITENKATYVNGVVKGTIKNNTKDIINNKYLKIDMYTKRDVNVGTRYVAIENLQPNESKDFEMWYELTNVDYVIITTTEDGKEINESNTISYKLKFYVLAYKLLSFYFMA